MNPNYSLICTHPRLERLNNNFVRCTQCGLSMVNQQHIPTNKRPSEFISENKSFTKNFNRNFGNVLEEMANNKNLPMLEYYTDKLCANNIVIDRRNLFSSDPPKYAVTVNSAKTYLTDNEIRKLFSDVGAIRVDENNIGMKMNIK